MPIWLTDPHKKEPPAHGAMQKYELFAWWPVACDDGYTRWLQKILITEKWHQWRNPAVNGETGAWEIVSTGAAAIKERYTDHPGH